MLKKKVKYFGILFLCKPKYKSTLWLLNNVAIEKKRLI